MKFFIRVDASFLIGTGHVMRCLTLAEAFKTEGHEIYFICRDYPGNLIEFINKRGFAVNVLTFADKIMYNMQTNSDNYSKWLWVSQKQDLDETIAILEMHEDIDWMIVDHYGLDQQWERGLKPHTRNIMVIDDLANRKHDCDILLDQNYYQNSDLRYLGLISDKCESYLGPTYALLRSQFYQMRAQLKTRDGVVRRILIFFGGPDHNNETHKALRAALSLNNKDIMIDVVVSILHVHKESIKNLCDAYPQAQYFCQIDNMAELMASADMTIGAGGTASWERCCLGLPALVMSVSENQEGLSRDLAAYGAIQYLGHADDISEDSIGAKCLELINNRNELAQMSYKGLQLVDGRGAEHIKQIMNNYSQE